MVPLVTSMVTPVILPERSEARNTATLAMSFIMGSFLSMVSSSSFLIKSATSAPPLARASTNGLESGDPADLMFTTRTPCGPSSVARSLEKPSSAQQAGPKPPTSG
ncbi:hypothetical protein D3C87_1420700 [compost metagenome]